MNSRPELAAIQLFSSRRYAFESDVSDVFRRNKILALYADNIRQAEAPKDVTKTDGETVR